MALARSTFFVLALAACDRGSEREIQELSERLDRQDERISLLMDQVKRLTDDLEDERSRGARDAMAALSRLDERGLPAAPGGPASAPTGGPALSDLPPITCEGDRCTVPRATHVALRADPAGLAKQARMMPSIQGDAMVGLKLFGVRSTSLFRAVGIENGDIITELGGRKLTSMEAAMTAYTEVLERDEWSLKGDRKGVPFERTIVVAK